MTAEPARENPRAKQAFQDYLNLGEDRSLEALAEAYQTRTEPVPTRQLSRLKTWSARYQWQLRLRGIADQEAARRERAYLRARAQEFGDGYGTARERVRGLKRQATRTVAALEGLALARFGPDGQPLPPSREAVELAVKLIASYRGLLADIAEEAGDRGPRYQYDSVDLERWAADYAEAAGDDPEEARRLAREVWLEGARPPRTER